MSSLFEKTTSHAPTIPTTDVLGVRVSTLTIEDTVHAILGWGAADFRKPYYVCATSVHGIIEAAEDEEFKRILNAASLVTPDGMPLVWLGKLQGCRSMDRVYGPDLTLRVCELGVARGLRHFFYGGGEGVAKDLAERLRTRFRGMNVVGTYCPPFRELTSSEMMRIVDLVNEAQTDLLWVGLSTPKQERWINRALPHIRSKVLLSVGAAFDFHIGRV